MTRYFVAGGAGFVGSHIVRALLAKERGATVTVFDNFSSGRERHLGPAIKDARVRVVRGDIKDLHTLVDVMRGHTDVYHVASNPDIAKAMSQPDIDFWEGTYLTQNVLEAMRIAGVPRITYASGSGVYGDTGTLATHEDYAPLLPISTYGASKLAGEALICSYCHMFDLRGLAFRFANVVGPHQTHGVGYDFIRSLRRDPSRLRVLGDGTQSKSYIHINDVLDAVACAEQRCQSRYEVFNVGTDDSITVTEIAHLAMEILGIPRESVEIDYTGGARGWRGDVPVVRLDLTRIHSLGWKATRGSRSARRASMQAMLAELDDNDSVSDSHRGSRPA
jgi:UDP-glucose 4-epimerase